MQIFSGIDEFNIPDHSGISTSIAIGKFDGIHLGHEKLIEEIVSHRRDGLSPLVVTFDSPVSDYFTGEHTRVLACNKEKTDRLFALGVEYIYMMPVNRQTMTYDPELFVRDVLCTGLHAGVIAAGADLSFGDKGAGNMGLLSRLSAELGYETVQIDKVKYGDEDISSSLIRQAVSSGDMERAGDMLGRPYFIDGRVRHGRQLGRTIDMPTVNLIPDDEKLLPPYGVYLSEVVFDDRQMYGITNIGVRPTVSDEDKVTVETFIYDFSGEIYGESIQVGLLHFMRPEIRFDSVDKLRKQLQDDKINGIMAVQRIKGS